jgi:hypothetical protein
MPPKSKLSTAEIETLKRWIDEGAVWPEGVDVAKLEDKTDWWSFKPLSGEPNPKWKDGCLHSGEAKGTRPHALASG